MNHKSGIKLASSVFVILLIFACVATPVAAQGWEEAIATGIILIGIGTAVYDLNEYHILLDKATDDETLAYKLYVPFFTNHEKILTNSKKQIITDCNNLKKNFPNSPKAHDIKPNECNNEAKRNDMAITALGFNALDMGFKRDAYTKAVTAIINCRPSDIKQLEKTPSECTGTDSTVSRGCLPKEIVKSKTNIQKQMTLETEAYNLYINDKNNFKTVKKLHEIIADTNQVINDELKRLNEKVKKTDL